MVGLDFQRAFKDRSLFRLTAREMGSSRPWQVAGLEPEVLVLDESTSGGSRSRKNCSPGCGAWRPARGTDSGLFVSPSMEDVARAVWTDLFLDEGRAVMSGSTARSLASRNVACSWSWGVPQKSRRWRTN